MADTEEFILNNSGVCIASDKEEPSTEVVGELFIINVFIDDTLRSADIDAMISSTQPSFSATDNDYSTDSNKYSVGIRPSNLAWLCHDIKKNLIDKGDLGKNHLVVYVPGYGCKSNVLNIQNDDPNIMVSAETAKWVCSMTSRTFAYINNTIRTTIKDLSCIPENKVAIDEFLKIKGSPFGNKRIRFNFFGAGTGAFVARFIASLLCKPLSPSQLERIEENHAKGIFLNEFSNQFNSYKQVDFVLSVLSARFNPYELTYGLIITFAGFVSKAGIKAVEAYSDVKEQIYGWHIPYINTTFIADSNKQLNVNEIEIGCLALFDTITREVDDTQSELFGQWLIPHDIQVKRIQKIIHLGAYDEFRDKFAFSPIGLHAKHYFDTHEFILPGSHEDIVGVERFKEPEIRLLSNYLNYGFRELRSSITHDEHSVDIKKLDSAYYIPGAKQIKKLDSAYYIPDAKQARYPTKAISGEIYWKHFVNKGYYYSTLPERVLCDRKVYNNIHSYSNSSGFLYSIPPEYWGIRQGKEDLLIAPHFFEMSDPTAATLTVENTAPDQLLPLNMEGKGLSTRYVTRIKGEISNNVFDPTADANFDILASVCTDKTKSAPYYNVKKEEFKEYYSVIGARIVYGHYSLIVQEIMSRLVADVYKDLLSKSKVSEGVVAEITSRFDTRFTALNTAFDQNDIDGSGSNDVASLNYNELVHRLRWRIRDGVLNAYDDKTLNASNEQKKGSFLLDFLPEASQPSESYNSELQESKSLYRYFIHNSLMVGTSQYGRERNSHKKFIEDLGISTLKNTSVLQNQRLGQDESMTWEPRGDGVLRHDLFPMRRGLVNSTSETNSDDANNLYLLFKNDIEDLNTSRLRSVNQINRQIQSLESIRKRMLSQQSKINDEILSKADLKIDRDLWDDQFLKEELGAQRIRHMTYKELYVAINNRLVEMDKVLNNIRAEVLAHNQRLQGEIENIVSWICQKRVRVSHFSVAADDHSNADDAGIAVTKIAVYGDFGEIYLDLDALVDGLIKLRTFKVIQPAQKKRT